jgi:hypothetical protein
MPSLSTIRREATTHTSLNDLAAELTRMQESKMDHVVDTRRMSFKTTETGSTLTFDTPVGASLMEKPEHGTDSGPVLDHAHGQIATRLGIPKKYYDRMRADAHYLLDTNVQHWFYQSPERRMIRMLDGKVRAFLSDRFRRLDNFDLMERSILPALHDIDGLEFHVASLTPERMVLRAILPGLAAEVLNVGDVVQAGFQIRNSEVGASAIAIEPFIWKLDCLNGMVSNVRSLRAYHVGRRIDDSEESMLVFRDDTLRADDTAFYLKARDAIKAAVDETVFAEIVEQMRSATLGVPISAPVASTQTLAQTFSLNDGERESVLASLARGGDLSRWGLVNAVTDAAKSADTFDRQEEIERIGGNVLTLAHDEWRKIAVAVEA